MVCLSQLGSKYVSDEIMENYDSWNTKVCTLLRESWTQTGTAVCIGSGHTGVESFQKSHFKMNHYVSSQFCGFFLENSQFFENN